VTDDTLWRIYSMTKPITSVAAMILYEEGRLALTDPVSAFIPAFEDVRVYDGGSDQKQVTVPAAEPVRVWHLLTHTAGLTYGFHRVHPVDALYHPAPAGELDGTRLLSPRTVGYMARNHLPGNKDLETFGRPLYAESPSAGSASASASPSSSTRCRAR